MNNIIFFLPGLSALIGWFGAWIAGKILLRRIITKQRQTIAAGVAGTLESSINMQDLAKKMADPEAVKKIIPLIEGHIDNFLRNKLKEKMPVVGMFISDKTVNSLKEIFLKEIEDMLPQVLTQFAGNLAAELDIKKLAMEKINALPVAQWEKLLSPVLRYYALAGAITGLITGLVNAAILMA